MMLSQPVNSLNQYASSPYLISPTRNPRNDELRRLTTSTFNETWFNETRIKQEPSFESSNAMNPIFSSDDVNVTTSALNYDQKWDRFPSKVDIQLRYGNDIWNRITDSYHQLLRFITEIKQEFEKPFEANDSEELAGYWATVDAIVIMQSKDAENWKEPMIRVPEQNARGGSWHNNPNLRQVGPSSGVQPGPQPVARPIIQQPVARPIIQQPVQQSAVKPNIHQPGPQPGVKPIIQQIQQRFNTGPNMTGSMTNENMNYNYRKSLEEARTANVRTTNMPRNVPNFIRARRGSTSVNVAHKCLHCDKSFMNMAHLRIHLRMHSGITPYKCQACEFKSHNKAAVMSNHFQNMHGRYGTNMDVHTDLEQLGRLEQLVAAQCETVIDNARREQQGEKFLNTISQTNFQRPGSSGQHWVQMNPSKEDEMEMKREAEEEGQTSPYFQNKFNELFGDGPEEDSSVSQTNSSPYFNTSSQNGSYGTDINRNNTYGGLAAKISSITGTPALNSHGVDTVETDKRLADELSFLK